MSKNLEEIKEDLKDIQNRWYGEGRFNDVNTMQKVEDDARTAKLRVVESHKHTKEMLAEFDKAIEISEDYHKRHAGLENENIRQALRHLENGIQQFFDRV